MLYTLCIIQFLHKISIGLYSCLLSSFGVIIVAATLYDLLTSPSLDESHNCDPTVNSAIASNDDEDHSSRLITDLHGPLYGTDSDVPLITVTPTYASRRKRVCSMCIQYIFFSHFSVKKSKCRFS